CDITAHYGVCDITAHSAVCDITAHCAVCDITAHRASSNSKGIRRKGGRQHRANDGQRTRAQGTASAGADRSPYTNNGCKDSAFDTLSLDSSDSVDTNVSACSPDNIS
ncbi:hypothetical protein scyTo_0021896, partial [Scyliorhinus torazame]|nr:hypothetical protein [Scyliorhinus torazame]